MQQHTTKTPTELLEEMTRRHRIVIRKGPVAGYFVDAINVVTNERDHSRWASFPLEAIVLLAHTMGIAVDVD